MRYLYLIKRGPRPDYHRAPYHPVIICDRIKVSEREAAGSDAHAWVWETENNDRGGGWLLVRWNGFDVDYGGVVRGIIMPDGSHSAFYRDYEVDPKHGGSVKDLFPGAVWWSEKVIPDWLKAKGVIYPPDNFTQDWILRVIGEITDRRIDRPKFWNEPIKTLDK